MIEGNIITYAHPDTDGVCSALAYASYLSLRWGRTFLPWFVGDIQAETQFVLDQAGIDIGAYRDQDVHKSYILLDTHNPSQLDYFRAYDQVIEIIDHHPDGQEDRFPRARVRNHQVGAVASLIGQEIIQAGMMSKDLACLLGPAILSNTLNFTAKSTRDIDRQVYKACQAYCDFGPGFVDEMFAYRDQILSLTSLEVLQSDLKTYEFYKKRVGISQVEVTRTRDLLSREDLTKALDDLCDLKDLDLMVFNLINLKTHQSFVLGSSQASKLLEKLFKSQPQDGVYCLGEIIQRKTDLVTQIRDLVKD